MLTRRRKARRRDGARKCTAVQVLLAAITLTLIACFGTANATETVISKSQDTSRLYSSDFIVVASPQEAYDRALYLLRSTLSRPSIAHRGSANPLRGQSEDSPNLFSKLKRYCDVIQSYSPLGIAQRLLYRVHEVLRSYSPLSSSKSKSTPKKSKQVWEGSSLVTASQSFAAGRDPVEEEQARKYPGARREQMWPEWDGGDDVFFGPFLSTSVDETSFRIKGMSRVEETFKTVLGSRVQTMKEKATMSAGLYKKRRAVEIQALADEHRAEAISLLTWAAGWGDAEVVQDRSALLNMPSQIDWTDVASSGSPSFHQSTASYIDNCLATNGTMQASNTSRPHADALWVLGTHSLWGTHGVTPVPARAKACFERLVSLNANATAHTKLAWLEGGAWSREGWKLMGVKDKHILPETEDRQARALLHYTSAAQGGDINAQNALAYRYNAGIGVPQNCGAALYWYEKVAKDAHQRYLSGPPGGLTLPYTHLRLSDISGGVFGPGSSAASTGMAKHRPAIQAALHSLPSDGSSDGRRLEDLLEFFTYHADRGSSNFALRLAKVYYGGSVLGSSESAARVQRDYTKASQYLLKITQEVWPTDSGVVRRGGPAGIVAKPGTRGDDVKLQVDDVTAVSAGIAAGMMGKMWLRGEGVRQNFNRSWVWFSRGKDQSDPESFNGLGIMYRDGLGISKDIKKAAEYFEAAATAHSVGGCLNLAKLYLQMNDLNNAAKWFDVALKLGDSFESYFYLASINIQLAHYPTVSEKDVGYKVGPPGTTSYERCRNAISGFKFAAERGDWKDGTFSRAERAWSKGFQTKALLGWTLAGEEGFEAAQNNVAWVLDRDKRRLRMSIIDAPESNVTDRLALIHWIRSAAQDNVDALVKMGDYYFHGLGLPEQTQADHWHTFPTSTIASQSPAATVSYEKAAACYSSAAEKQTSALAYWNMGFLYEKGLGVPKKDYNLAKRYYDMAVELNPQEAYLPVFLSLTKLILMAMWDAFVNKDASAISLLNSVTFGSNRIQTNLLGGVVNQVNTAGPYTEADEIRMKKGAEEKAQEEEEAAAVAMEMNEVYEDDQGQLVDPNLPETYESKRHSKNQSQREKEKEKEKEESDDTIEGLMIVIGVAALAWLVYARQGVQLRLDRMRRDNQGAADNAAAVQQPAPQSQGVQEQGQEQEQQGGPPVVDPNQPFGWPLQDGNAYAGL